MNTFITIFGILYVISFVIVMSAIIVGMCEDLRDGGDIRVKDCLYLMIPFIPVVNSLMAGTILSLWFEKFGDKVVFKGKQSNEVHPE